MTVPGLEDQRNVSIQTINATGKVTNWSVLLVTNTELVFEKNPREI